MSLKAILFTLGCLAAWFVLLPLLLIGGAALLTYAIFAEFSAFLIGSPGKAFDASAAREIARRTCGYGAQMGSTRRSPAP